ncbi:MAG: zinc ribbon domain-containing protein [bacterium]
MAVTVHKYRVPGWFVRQGGVPAVVDEQLRLAHDLGNDLVTLEHDYERDMAEVWSSYPDVAMAEKRRDEAEQRVADLSEKVAEERRRQGTRAPKHPAVAELREAKAALRQARVERREAISAVREQAKARTDRLRDDLRAAQKRLYADYVQGRGLYWAVYNDVLARHRVAVQRIQAKRRAGRPAMLRHHRWDGTGALAVQLQRQADDPVRSPELLASGQGKWRNVLQIAPWVDPESWEDLPRGERRRRARTGTATMRLGSSPVELPVIVHRMMPADADIVEARLVIERVAQRRRIHLCVTARVPDPDPVEHGLVVAVHGGWRLEPDGSIRVATWRADGPVDVPWSVRDVVRADTDRTGTVVLPDLWRDGLARPDELRSERDRHIDDIRADLTKWLTDNPQPTDEGWPTAAEVARWRSPRRFAALARDMRDDPPPGSEQILARLLDWEQWDRRMWGRQEHGRDKHLGRRDDAWRRVAAFFATVAGRIVVDDTDLATLVRRVAAAETSVPAEVTSVAARQRVDAAPGKLRSCVTVTAQRDGVPVTVVSSVGLSSTCRACGRDGNLTDSHEVVCGCGHRYDRDTSATALMLDRASADSDT